MIKAVLFDLDNTLLDFYNTKIKCAKASIKAMTRAGMKMNRKEAFNELMHVYRVSSYEDPLIFEHFLKKKFGSIDYKVLSAAIVAYRRISYTRLIPYEGVPETLRKLRRKGIKLGIVTDAPRLKAWVRLTNAGLSDYFNIVITLGDSKRRKPHKTPFRKALRMLKVKPEEVLFVGDNLEKDIAGAKSIGMQTAFARYGSFLRKKPANDSEKPDYVLKKFKELTRLVLERK